MNFFKLAIAGFKNQNFKIASIPMLYEVERGHNGLEDALEGLLKQAKTLVESGTNILILSDRYVSAEKAPIPNCGLQEFRLLDRNRGTLIGILPPSAFQ